MTRSAMRWIWQKRASAAAGMLGLKMQPLGAMTLIGRKEPSLAGMSSCVV